MVVIISQLGKSLYLCTMQRTCYFSKVPMYIMTKTVGSTCNLACKYCYYLEKVKLYNDKPQHLMSDKTLELFIKQYIESQTMNEVLFTWHGGEPLLRPISFYEHVIKLQKQYARGRHIDNCIQTNGVLINDDWARFFHDNGWLVGVSIDGPEAVHNAFRKKRNGEGSFAEVMRGIEILNRHHVEWNALAVVNHLNANDPLGFYRFFKEIDCHYIQFTPIVERLIGEDSHLASLADEGDSTIAPFSVTPAQWGNFLCTLFDEWVRNDVGDYYVQLFDATLANWVGVAPGVCSMARNCGHAGVMEFNGDVYSCDHFVFPQYKLGNIHQQTLVEMMYGDKEYAFGKAKFSSLPRQCKQCKWLFACNGECPKNRFVTTADGERGLNYLCEGYHQFFEHVAPYMDYMKRKLDKQQPPADIVEDLRSGLFIV